MRLRILGISLIAASSITISGAAGATPLSPIDDDEYPKASRIFPDYAECLVVNGEFQRYYRTTECKRTLGSDPPQYWFAYWPK